MTLRSFGACVVAAAALTESSAASEPGVPLFALSATRAAVGNNVQLRVERSPSLAQRTVHLYLVSRSVAGSVHSRFDTGLSFVGFVRAKRSARLSFTVPPLQAGQYKLAYWCRGCLPIGKPVGVQASPSLQVTAPNGAGCPTTLPNGKQPVGASEIPDGAAYHGNGALAVVLRRDGLLVTNPLGGAKMRWWASGNVSGHLTVQYRMYDSSGSWLTARTLTDTLHGPDSTMSQMSFTPGCWQVAGHVSDMNLSFIVQVVLGSS